MEPTFVTLEQAIAIQESQLRLHGGLAGIRDRGGLESAVAQARASFGGEYLHPTVFDQAAAYLYHLTKNHPFLDGNKRAGAATAVTFLAMNGYDLPPTLDDGPFYDLVLRVATGQADKPEIAAFFRSQFQP